MVLDKGLKDQEGQTQVSGSLGFFLLYMFLEEKELEAPCLGCS